MTIQLLPNHDKQESLFKKKNDKQERFTPCSTLELTNNDELYITVHSTKQIMIF